MKNQFASYEISLKLKELGFDEECLACYYPWSSTDQEFQLPPNRIANKFNKEFINAKAINGCATPLWQQAIDWFREKHDIDIVITPDSDSQCRIPLRKYFVTFWKYHNGISVQPQLMRKDDIISYFVNPNNAREQAILKAIELINERTL